jgi:ComF family protein
MRFRAFLNRLLDAVLPRRERATRTSLRSLEDIPVSPRTHTLLEKEITTLMTYGEPAVEDLVRSLKYDRSREAARLAALILADYLRDEIAASRAFSTKPVLLVPVPLHETRRVERGYNQIERVLQELPKEFKSGELAFVVFEALMRVRNTPPQTRLSRRERLVNVAGAFEVSDPENVRDVHIFLIDDVTTTGATLVEAAKPLEEFGVPVSLIALARA